VLLAIDESAASQAAVNEVLRRLWPADTTVRVLHVVEKFVPPAQELWYDAGGNLDQARQEIKARFRSLVEETAARVAEHNLNSEISIRDGNAGKVIVQEAKEWNADVIFVGSRGHVTLKVLGHHPLTWALAIAALVAVVISRLLYHGKPDPKLKWKKGDG
jgi:nucleotide-binding universal stress UspA family protein